MVFWILIIILLLMVTWLFFGNSIKQRINDVKNAEQILLHECELDIIEVFLLNFPDIPRHTIEEHKLHDLSVMFTIILSGIAYDIDDKKKTDRELKQLEQAQFKFLNNHLKATNKLTSMTKSKQEMAKMNIHYLPYAKLFMQCLSHLDYQLDLEEMSNNTSFRALDIDKRLQKMTSKNKDFSQGQCDFYANFLTDYIHENHHIEFYVKKSFQDEDYRSKHLSQEGRLQAFYFFEVCYQVFLDILRYRLKH